MCGLLQKYMEVEGIELNKEDFKNYNGMLKGFPDQVKFAYKLISKYGAERAYDFSDEIENYDTEIIAQILKELEESESDIEFLKLLTEIDMISYQSLQNILGG